MKFSREMSSIRLTKKSELVVRSIVIALLFGASDANSSSKDEKNEFFQRPGVQASELIRARGYLAEDFQFITDDGYVLGITRARNPLMSEQKLQQLNKDPMLFVHGSLVNANCFISNSFDLRGPKDMSDIDVIRMSEEQLIELLGDEPAATTLPFLAMNFGHEVWLLHRRGSELSQARIHKPDQGYDGGGPSSVPPTPVKKYRMAVKRFRQLKEAKLQKLAHGGGEEQRLQESEERDDNETARSDKFGWRAAMANSTRKGNQRRKMLMALISAPEALLDYGNLMRDVEVTLDRRLWNHSLDEQAAYDLPNAVDYVLEQSKRDKLAMIGDSSGGALVIMTLILEPSLKKKLSKVVAWAPSFNIGNGENARDFSLARPFLDHLGPFPFTFLTYPLQALLEMLCSSELLQHTVCSMMIDSNWGKSFGLAPVRAEFQSENMTPVSGHEFLQLVQFQTMKRSHFFDHNSVDKNMAAYGRPKPPRYSPALIDFEHLSLWISSSDNLVTERDLQTIVREMRVPHTVRIIRDRGVNHGAFFYHNDVAKLVVIPTYRDIVATTRSLSEDDK